MIDWQSVLTGGVVAFIVAAGPVIILFILQRKGANKRLSLDETTVAADVFDKQTKAYSELYETAKADLAQAKKDLIAANETAAGMAAELKKYQQERETLMKQVKEQGAKIERLEKADHDKTDELADARTKVEQLRSLFTSILERTQIVMTAEEQQIFDNTKPKWLITKEGRANA